MVIGDDTIGNLSEITVINMNSTCRPEFESADIMSPVICDKAAVNKHQIRGKNPSASSTMVISDNGIFQVNPIPGIKEMNGGSVVVPHGYGIIHCIDIFEDAMA